MVEDRDIHKFYLERELNSPMFCNTSCSSSLSQINTEEGLGTVVCDATEAVEMLFRGIFCL